MSFELIESVFCGFIAPSLLVEACFGTFGLLFSTFKLLCLAKDHRLGFITRNAHMAHIVNLIRFKMVCTSS